MPPPLHPNAVWLEFLEAWAAEAHARGTKSATAFRRARDALAAHAEPFAHPRETVALPGIGASIATRLERAFAEWCREHGEAPPQPPDTLSTHNNAPRSQDAAAAPKRRRTREYIPAPRSGAHGLLVALYIKAGDADAPGASKPELIALAQPYCDSDYWVPGGAADVRSLALRQGGPAAGRARSHITAWNAIKTLLDKEYVYKSGNPPVYSLSEQGLTVAKVLAEAEGIAPAPSPAPAPAVPVDLVATSDDDSGDVRVTPRRKGQVCISLIDSSPIIECAPAPKPADRSLTLDAGTYDIVLVMDHREVRQRPDGGERVTFESAMAERGVPCELRALELGDVVWTARARAGVSGAQAEAWHRIGEVVLDVVVERKRLDDLTSSIVDGRWHDQKKRLRHAGIGTVFYVVEDVDVDNLVRRYGAQIQTALSSTQVIDRFFVHRTAGTSATADFFAAMHRAVCEMYAGQPLCVLPDEAAAASRDVVAAARAQRVHTSFHAFQALNGRAVGTLADLWVSMLLCVQGMSAEKAQQVAQRWPTPQAFMRAAAAGGPRFVCDAIDHDVALPRRRIGPALSARLWELFS